MKLVYIAGRFRGSTPWEVEEHVRTAETYALAVAKMGLVPVCPHTMYRHFDKTLPDEFWLEASQKLLARCDAILMIPGWLQSEGACSEFQYATHEGIRVFKYDDMGTLAEWSKELLRG